VTQFQVRKIKDQVYEKVNAASLRAHNNHYLNKYDYGTLTTIFEGCARQKMMMIVVVVMIE